MPYCSYKGRGIAAIAIIAAIALAVIAPSAHAQRRAADITVSKNRDANADAGMFTTVQDAVNAARSGQIIEILDTEVYEEQVTIDGRDESFWDGNNGGPVTKVVGGKHGITIRSRNPTSVNKPTIKWRDTRNVHPKTSGEAYQPNSANPGDADTNKVPGYAQKTAAEKARIKDSLSELNGSGNFETCGALRIIRAQGVIIDGIAVDGGSAFPFGWPSIWESRHPLSHGNAGITLVVASGAVIRNCEIRNAYYGINVKDRNTGGVFGNPNPADNDVTVPLSGFGKVGNHLIEYNRVHNNSMGFFFESAWDLGSTVRYNLIYDNFHTAATKAAFATLPDTGNRATGGFLFKDMILSPVAIYNNTFFRNYSYLYADWQVGASHLIFNNIYGRSSEPVGTRLNFVDAMGIEHKFPYRMNNCLFSALADLKAETRYIEGCRDGYSGQNIVGITQVRISNNFPNPPTGATTVQCLAPIADQTATATDFIPPGGRLTNAAIPQSANLRWLETSRSIAGTEELFVSTDPASADFLRPKWDHAQVEQFIKNKGWGSDGAAGTAAIRNSDGKIADIGAIPSTGQAPATVARIKPSNVVLVNGTQADASFYITLESGEFRNPKISFLRWVAPLPYSDVVGGWGTGGAVAVPQSSITNMTPPTTVLSVGNNSLRFTLPRALGARDEYGFFEMVIEGTDAFGNTVTSDVGFLPYRELDYKLEITVLRGTTAVTTVKAGEALTLRVQPVQKNGQPFNLGTLKEVTYDLLSDAAAFMYRGTVSNPPQNPLVYDTNLPTAGQTYNIYFTRAGQETIMGAGLYESGAQRLVFLGTRDLVVEPGPPERPVFISPIPTRQLGGALPQVISSGAPYDVQVEVQDRFGNATNESVPVTIRSLADAIGSVAPASASTNRATGAAGFTANVTGGRPGDEFLLVATYGSYSDTGSLRVGRTLDAFRVYYGDAGPADNVRVEPDSVINKMFSEWAFVTVKAVVSDAVMTNRNGFVVVERSDATVGGLVFSATEGGPPADRFALTGGIATFWVGAEQGFPTDILDAEITVRGLTSAGAEDNSIQRGTRGEITFTKPKTSVVRAEVFGDGEGRPTRVDVYYTGGKLGAGIELPASLSIRWPSVLEDSLTVAVTAAMITGDSVVLSVPLAPIAARLPTGFTELAGNQGIVTLHAAGGGAPNSAIDVVDKIGPVISSSDDASISARGVSPVIVENMDQRVTPDVIRITMSEAITDELHLRQLLYSPSGVGAGVELNVASVSFGGRAMYVATVSPGETGVVPVAGGYIKVAPSSLLADRSGNGVLADNRWVQLVLEEVQPSYSEAWYTSDPATGRPDTAYIRFDKPVNVATWFGGAGATRIADAVVEANVGDYMTVVDTFVLKMDLRIAVPAVAGPGAAVRTSGAIEVRLAFSSAQSEWENMVVVANDKAKPVLAAGAELRMGGVCEGVGDGCVDGFARDTLVVIYSEILSAADEDPLSPFRSPVTILRDGRDVCTPVLTGAAATAASGSFRRVTYLIESIGCASGVTPSAGDSIRINHTAGVEDYVGNVQDAERNLRQPLTVKASPIKWSVKVKNNPFRADAGGGGAATIELSPGAKGRRLVTKATFIVFDNMGSVVTVDDKTVDNPNDNTVIWSWNGYNQKGRMAGTGAYLLKVICDTEQFGEGGGESIGRQKYSVSRTIGLVRGGK